WRNRTPCVADCWVAGLDVRRRLLQERRSLETETIRRSVGFLPVESEDMNDPAASARDWMEQAQVDLAAARLLRDGGQWALACFPAQPAAEKALTALLAP